MTASFKILDRSDFKPEIAEHDTFAKDVLAGLSTKPKHLPSKYFYDEKGSELFSKIMELPEYYLTRSEFEILDREKRAIGDFMQGDRYNLVELGAGDGKKTRILLEHFLSRGLDFRYLPIDISPSYMEGLVDSLSKEFPALEIMGIVSDYFEGLQWIRENTTDKSFVLMLGSNVGNFPPAEAAKFFHALWFSLNNGDFIFTGFDLQKDIDTLRRAYGDNSGVTAAFNYNLLHRMNRELGADFNIDRFRHYAAFNFKAQAMESYLVSQCDQTVHISELGRAFSFDAWEPLHTEHSYKYSLKGIAAMAESYGFKLCRNLFDSKEYFCDSIWQAVKRDRAM